LSHGTTAISKAANPARPTKVRVCWVEKSSPREGLKSDWIEFIDVLN
jgi:hypothetical protein